MFKRSTALLLLTAVIVLSAAFLGDRMLTNDPVPQDEAFVFELSEVPAYDGSPYTEINGGLPFFAEDIDTSESFERYGELDGLGRCTGAFANVGKDLMPTGPRESISGIRPTGWHLVRYDELGSDLYLYNRCHLIARQLTGEDANERNLITGTRYMNVSGLLPFENRVAEYVRSTGNHVLYRAVPVFEGSELLCRGVHLEALSVEDGGIGVRFNVFVYNVQPGIVIDYLTGDSHSDGSFAARAEKEGTETSNGGSSKYGQPGDGDASSADRSESRRTQADPDPRIPEGIYSCGEAKALYVLNLNTRKFHFPGCGSVLSMSPGNKYYTGSPREDIINAGFEPCRICIP